MNLTTILLASSIIVLTPNDDGGNEDTIPYIQVQPDLYSGSDGSQLKQVPDYSYKPEQNLQRDVNPYQWGTLGNDKEK